MKSLNTRQLNRNIGCIEIVVRCLMFGVAPVLNRNIGCIEIPIMVFNLPNMDIVEP